MFFRTRLLVQKSLLRLNFRARQIATLLTLAAPGAALAQVTITAQPQPVTVQVGQPATFTVAATATGTPAFQWRRGGYALPGATQSSFTIPSVSQGDNALYDVVVSKGADSATSQPVRLLATLPSYPNDITVSESRSLRLETTASGEITAQAVLPDGRYYLAGSFVSASGQARRYLARFLANGSLDTVFTPPVFDTAPSSLAVQPDGKLIVSGSFRTVDAVATGKIVRLNPDGSRDATFLMGAGFTQVFGTVKAQLAPDGRIYVISTNTSSLGAYQGATSLGYAVRLSSTGALDSTFVAPTVKYGIASVSTPNFLITPTGDVYIYGTFDRVGDVSRASIARLLPGGGPDPTFDVGSGPNSFIRVAAVLENGQIVLGGGFTSFNGASVGSVIRINSNGSRDTSFTPNLTGSVGFLAALPGNKLFIEAGIRLTSTGAGDSSVPFNLQQTPSLLSVLPDGRLLVSGTNLTSSKKGPGAFVMETDGSVASLGQPSLAFKGRATYLAHLPGGKILVGGDFTAVNGVAAPNLIRLNADLTRDLTFPNGPGPSAPVSTGTLQPDGKIILSVGYSSDSRTLIRLNADGSADSTFALNFAIGGLTAPFVLPDGKIFAINDGTRPAVIDPSGNLILNHPIQPGPSTSSSLYAIRRLINGQFLITGSFNDWNGTVKSRAVRFKTDGTIDGSFTLDPTFASASQYTLSLSSWGPAYQTDGRLIMMNNNRMFARINSDGSMDTSFGGVQSDFFDAGSFLIQPDDRIIVRGQGQPTISEPELPNIFYRFTKDGVRDQSFVVRGSGYWSAAILADNGELITSDDSGYLQRYVTTSGPIITEQPTAISAPDGTSATLHVSATGTGTLTYQWYKDGVAVAGATDATLSFARLKTAIAGNYTVVVRDATGTKTSNVAKVSTSTFPIPGMYFGSLGIATESRFAMLIREDYSAAFLGFTFTSSAPTAALVSREFVVDEYLNFSFPVSVITASGTTQDTVTGSIRSVSPGGAFTAINGTVIGLGQTLSATTPVTTPPGPTATAFQALAGFYQAGEVGRAGLGYGLVGDSGLFFVVTTSDQNPVGAWGVLDIADSASLAGNSLSRAQLKLKFTRGVPPRMAITVTAPVNNVSTSSTFSGTTPKGRTEIEQLVNISTRTPVPAGSSFTAGFVVVGDKPKPVLIRGIGPTLASFDVQGALPAVHMEVYRKGTLIATGDDWGNGNAADIAATTSRVGGFALSPGSHDAALLLTLEPSDYTVIISGQNGAAGIALAEIYDATEGAIPTSRRIVNISTRADAGTGSATLISGFFINGSVPKRVLVRGAGPSLAPFGVSTFMPRPVLSVFKGTTKLAENAGWADSPALAAASAQVGAFAFLPASRDAALIITLEPGSYTAQVTSTDGSVGNALVEVYEIP